MSNIAVISMLELAIAFLASTTNARYFMKDEVEAVAPQKPHVYDTCFVPSSI